MQDAADVAVSPRESEVLEALADRLTNREIAERLVLSVRTVEAHVAALLRKLGAANRRELATTARARRLRLSAAPASRLPATLTRFVGREAELAELASACRTNRLVTIVGPAGVGKTRLSIEAAQSMTDVGDPLFVDLAPRHDSAGLWAALASALAVGEVAGRTLQRAVLDQLNERATLLLLDNCEHVLDAAAELVTRLLADTPSTRVLATGREQLSIAGEQVLVLAPLEVPSIVPARAETVADRSAVQLFVDRAQSVDAAFRLDDDSAPAVASICRSLDGMPLALELAAAQLPALTPSQIDARLRDRFRLLRAPRRGSSTRHQALDAAVSWSWDLLQPRERALLDRLSVFRGSFTLEAAEQVATGSPVAEDDLVDLLVSLVRKSLVVPQRDGTEHRYRLLETMREFGWRRLEGAGELTVWRERHRQWMFGVLREAAAGLSCGVVPSWLDALDADLDNMAASLEWSLATADGAAEALGVVRGLEHYWMARGVRRAHGVRWSTMAAEKAVGVAASARVESLLGAVLLVMWSDLHAAATLADQAVRLAESSADRTAIGYAALAQAWVAIFRGDVATGSECAGVASSSLDAADSIHPWVSFMQVMIRAFDGRHDETARAMVEVADEFHRNDDAHMWGAILTVAADFEAVIGDRAGAGRHVETGLDQARIADCASCLSQALASASLLADDPAERLDAARRAVRLAHEIAEPWGVLRGLEATVGALAATGALADAALLAGAARAVRLSTGMVAILPGRDSALTGGEATARAGLGEDACAALVRDGMELDYASAVAHALG